MSFRIKDKVVISAPKQKRLLINAKFKYLPILGISVESQL